MISTLSTESEYIGQSDIIKQAIYLYQFLSSLRLPGQLPMPIYTDNQSAITVANKNQYRARTKYINIYYYY